MTTAELLDALARAGYRGAIMVQTQDGRAVEADVYSNGWIIQALYTRIDADDIDTIYMRYCHKSRRQKYVSKHARKPYV